MCPPLIGGPVYDRLVMNEEGKDSGTICYLNNVTSYTFSVML